MRKDIVGLKMGQNGHTLWTITDILIHSVSSLSYTRNLLLSQLIKGVLYNLS